MMKKIFAILLALVLCAGMIPSTATTASASEMNDPITYTIATGVSTVGQPVKGTVVASKSRASAGETITITATPNEGYRLDGVSVGAPGDRDKVTVTPVSGEAGKYTFTMPAANVAVMANFVAIEYQVEVKTNGNYGTVTADKTSAAKGEQVTLTISPNEGYEYTVSVHDYYHNSFEVDENNTFIMPAANVVVEVAFSRPSNKVVKVAAVDPDGNYMAGAELGLYFTDGFNPLVAWTSTNGVDEVDMSTWPPYEYIIYSDSPPAGYLSGEVQFSIDADGIITADAGDMDEDGVLLLRLERTSVSFQLVDENSNPLDVHVRAQVKDKTGMVAYEFDFADASHEITLLKVGEQYTLHLMGTEDYQLPEDIVFTILNDGKINASVNVDGSTISIKLSKNDVTKYGVTIKPTQNGTVTADKASAAEGETVHLTIDPDEGYQCDLIYVRTEYWDTVEVLEGNSFIMPAAPVVVEVGFSLVPATIKVAVVDEGGSFVENVYLDIENTNTNEKKGGWKSDDNVKEIRMSELGPGAYLIRAFQTPAGWLYSQVSFSISEEYELIADNEDMDENGRLLVKMKPTVVSISVVDDETGAPVNGATVQIIHQDYGYVLYEFNSVQESKVITNELPTDTRFELKVTPPDGYEEVEGNPWFQINFSGSFNGTDYLLGENGVKIPLKKKAVPHSVSIDSTQNGTVTADKPSAVKGEKVTLTITPDKDYQLNSIRVYDNVKDIELAEDNTFTMPDSDVTVTAKFVPSACSIKVAAVDPDGKYMADVSLAIYDQFDESIRYHAWTSSAEAKTLSMQVPNSLSWYQIKATAVPEGWRMPRAFGFIITPDGQISINTEVEDQFVDGVMQIQMEPTEVKITVHDPSQSPIPSAKVSIYDGEKRLATKDCDQDGWVDFTRLPMNKPLTVKVEADKYIHKDPNDLPTFEIKDDDSIEVSGTGCTLDLEMIRVELDTRTYNITIRSSEHGTVTYRYPTAAQDTTVNLEIIPEPGYKLAYLSINGENRTSELNGTHLPFIMPAKDVTISAVFEPKWEKVSLQLKVLNLQGNIYEPWFFGSLDNLTVDNRRPVNLKPEDIGTHTISFADMTPNGCYPPTDITFTLNSDGTITCNGNDVTVDYEGGVYYLVIPLKGIPYNITIASSKHGWVRSDERTALYGDTVTLTIVPDEGYQLGWLQLEQDGYPYEFTDQVDANNQCQFEMPDTNVIVHAQFIPIPTYSVSCSNSAGGAVTANPGTGVKEGEQVTLTIAPEEGYYLQKLTMRDNNGVDQDITNAVANNQYTFTMPGGNVFVIATFKDEWEKISLRLKMLDEQDQLVTSYMPGTLDGVSVVSNAWSTVRNLAVGEHSIALSTHIGDSSGYLQPDDFTFRVNEDGTITSDNVEVEEENGVYYFVIRLTSRTYTVTVVPSEHGTVTASPTALKYDETYLICITPDDGYELDKLWVWDADNDTVRSNMTWAVNNNRIEMWMPKRDQMVQATFKKSPVHYVTAYEGERASMTFAVPDAASYQWHVYYNDEDGWYECGENKSTYTSSPVKPSNNGYRYMCVVTLENGRTVHSPVFILRVLTRPAVPQTGDDAPIALWLAMTFLSCIGMLAIVRYGKKKQAE